MTDKEKYAAFRKYTSTSPQMKRLIEDRFSVEFLKESSKEEVKQDAEDFWVKMEEIAKEFFIPVEPDPEILYALNEFGKQISRENKLKRKK